MAAIKDIWFPCSQHTQRTSMQGDVWAEKECNGQTKSTCYLQHTWLVTLGASWYLRQSMAGSMKPKEVALGFAYEGKKNRSIFLIIGGRQKLMVGHITQNLISSATASTKWGFEFFFIYLRKQIIQLWGAQNPSSTETILLEQQKYAGIKPVAGWMLHN